ncbi:MAG: ABC-type uncharacterized transport system, periplasmic component [Tardiphaga sp.]|jgi:ABC-type uncharacterized transport system substrate-binding protein|nr:ABC-type uncharacterized transport system, periplasmic component [Tardiphaga sp.]
MLTNPTYQSTAAEVRDVQVVGRALGLQIEVANASTGGEIDAAFASFEREQPDALIVGGDPVLLSQDQLVSLAASHTLPAIYAQREYVDAGGLMSYGTSLIDGYLLSIAAKAVTAFLALVGRWVAFRPSGAVHRLWCKMACEVVSTTTAAIASASVGSGWS